MMMTKISSAPMLTLCTEVPRRAILRTILGTSPSRSSEKFALEDGWWPLTLKPSGLSSGGTQRKVHHVPYRDQPDGHDEQNRTPSLGRGVAQ